MLTIKITTQAELDALPDSFTEYTVIELRGGTANDLLYVRKARENSSVEARGNSSVVAWENSSVVAWENSSVVAWENSSVVARENSSRSQKPAALSPPRAAQEPPDGLRIKVSPQLPGRCCCLSGFPRTSKPWKAPLPKLFGPPAPSKNILHGLLKRKSAVPASSTPAAGLTSATNSGTPRATFTWRFRSPSRTSSLGRARSIPTRSHSARVGCSISAIRSGKSLRDGLAAAQFAWEHGACGEDDPIGPCPEPGCPNETTNYEGKPRRSLEWLPCDDCRPCKGCEEKMKDCTCNLETEP